MTEEFEIIELKAWNLAGNTFEVNWNEFIKAATLNDIKVLYKKGKHHWFPLPGVVVWSKE